MVLTLVPQPVVDALTTALMDYFHLPGQRWHRGRATNGKVVYDGIPERDLSLVDWDKHLHGQVYLAPVASARDPHAATRR